MYIQTVASVFRWEPAVIGRLFLDDIDHYGIIYWYEAAKKLYPEIRK